MQAWMKTVDSVVGVGIWSCWRKQGRLVIGCLNWARVSLAQLWKNCVDYASWRVSDGFTKRAVKVKRMVSGCVD